MSYKYWQMLILWMFQNFVQQTETLKMLK